MARRRTSAAWPGEGTNGPQPLRSSSSGTWQVCPPDHAVHPDRDQAVDSRAECRPVDGFSRRTRRAPCGPGPAIPRVQRWPARPRSRPLSPVCRACSIRRCSPLITVSSWWTASSARARACGLERVHRSWSARGSPARPRAAVPRSDRRRPGAPGHVLPAFLDVPQRRPGGVHVGRRQQRLSLGEQRLLGGEVLPGLGVGLRGGAVAGAEEPVLRGAESGPERVVVLASRPSGRLPAGHQIAVGGRRWPPSRRVGEAELNHMLHRLCGSPSIPLSFSLAAVLPRRSA